MTDQHQRRQLLAKILNLAALAVVCETACGVPVFDAESGTHGPDLVREVYYPVRGRKRIAAEALRVAARGLVVVTPPL